MILQQNYTKIAQYTQRAFKKYARRSLSYAVLKAVQNRKGREQLDQHTNANQNFGNLISNSEIDKNQGTSIAQNSLIDQSLIIMAGKQSKRKTQKNIYQNDNYDASFLGIHHNQHSHQQIHKRQSGLIRKSTDKLFNQLKQVQQFVPLYYGDFIFIQSQSDHAQGKKVRIYSQLDYVKASTFQNICIQEIDINRCIFEICNPYESSIILQNNQRKKNTDLRRITQHSLCTFRNIFTDSYLKVELKNLSYKNQFGFQVFLAKEDTPNKSISKQCIFQFRKALQFSNQINGIGIFSGDLASQSQQGFKTGQPLYLSFLCKKQCYLSLCNDQKFQYEAFCSFRKFAFRMQKPNMLKSSFDTQQGSFEYSKSYVVLRSLYAERYLSAQEIDSNSLFTKKTFNNIIIESDHHGATDLMIENELERDNQNGNIKKGINRNSQDSSGKGNYRKTNNIVLEQLQANKKIQSNIIFKQKNQACDKIQLVWSMLKVPSFHEHSVNMENQQVCYKLSNLVAAQGVFLKNQKHLKLTSNFSGKSENPELSPITLLDIQRLVPDLTLYTPEYSPLRDESQREKIICQLEVSKTPIGVFLDANQQYQLLAIKNERNSQQISLKAQQDRRIFQLSVLSRKQSQLIAELTQILFILKKVYKFLQKWGFKIDKGAEILVYSTQESKKTKIILKQKLKEVRKVLLKLSKMLQQQNQQSEFNIKNIIKKLKILQILIGICKLITLKMGNRLSDKQKKQRKQSNINLGANQTVEQSESLNQNFQKNGIKKTQIIELSEHFEFTSESPFMFASKQLRPLFEQIMFMIYQLAKNNKQCSNLIINEASYFNRLLQQDYPEMIGEIMQEAIKNLSIFTTKKIDHQKNQLFQWAKLIETITERSVRIQRIYIDIIAEIVVDPNDKGIIPYQNKCRELLFTIQSSKKKTLPKFSKDGQKPTIIFQNSQNMKKFLESNKILAEIPLASKKSASFHLEIFFTYYRNCQKVFKDLLKLMRNLCKDRNKKLSKVVQDCGLSQQHIQLAMAYQNISWQLKIAYLNLYLSLYVDQDPFISFEKREVKCHIWNKISEYNLNQKTAIIFKQYTDSLYIGERLKAFDAHVIPLIDQFLEYFDKKLEGSDRCSIQNQTLQNQDIDCFIVIMKTIYEGMKFGYFTPLAIKNYVYAVLIRSSKLLKLKSDFKKATNKPRSTYFTVLISQELDQREQGIYQQKQAVISAIADIIILNQMIFTNIQGILFIKNFQQDYQVLKPRATRAQVYSVCLNILKGKMKICQSRDVRSVNIGNSWHNRKKTTHRYIGLERGQTQQISQKKLIRFTGSYQQFDQAINEFLLQAIIQETIYPKKQSFNRVQFSGQASFNYETQSHAISISKIFQALNLKSQRHLHICNFLQSIMTINNRNEQEIYKNFNGRQSNRLLNALKIQELVDKIKALQFGKQVVDNEDEKRKGQKILQLNNLLLKIIREMQGYYTQNKALFRKCQQILQKFGVHQILVELLNYSEQPSYYQLICSVYDFYSQFIEESPNNKRIISKYFDLMIKNFKFPHFPEILGQIFLQIQNKEHAFEKIIKCLQKKGDYHLRSNQSILETISKIIRKCKDVNQAKSFKNMFILHIIKSNDIERLLKSNTPSSSFVSIICFGLEKNSLMAQRIKRLFLKSELFEKIISGKKLDKKTDDPNKNSCLKYQQRLIILNLYFYLYIDQQYIQQIELNQLIGSMILPQLKHLPTVCHNMVIPKFLNDAKYQRQTNKYGQSESNKLETINGFSFRRIDKMQQTINQNQQNFCENSNEQISSAYHQKQKTREDDFISKIERIYKRLVVYEFEQIEPSQEQSYWKFMLSHEDKSQMSLLNFATMLIKRYNPQSTQNSSVYQLLKYVKQLNMLLQLMFISGTTEYQRSLSTKIQELEVCIEEKLQMFPKPPFHQNQRSNALLLKAHDSKFQDRDNKEVQGAFKQNQTDHKLVQAERNYLKRFFNQFSEIIKEEKISYHSLLQCMGVDQNQLRKKRLGHKVEKLILEVEFGQRLKKLAISINGSQASLSKLISGDTISRLFENFRDKNLRKMNIYFFMEKLVKTLQYLKVIKINSYSEAIAKQINNGKRYNTEEQTNFQLHCRQLSQNLLGHFNKYSQSQQLRQIKLKSSIKEICDCLNSQLNNYCASRISAIFQHLLRAKFISQNQDQNQQQVPRINKTFDLQFFSLENIFIFHWKYRQFNIVEYIIHSILHLINQQHQPKTTFEISKLKSRYLDFIISKALQRDQPSILIIKIIQEVYVMVEEKKTLYSYQSDNTSEAKQIISRDLIKLIKVLTQIDNSQILAAPTSYQGNKLQIFEMLMRFIEKCVFVENSQFQEIQNFICLSLIKKVQKLNLRDKNHNSFELRVIKVLIETLIKNGDSSQKNAQILSSSEKFREFIYIFFSEELEFCLQSTNLDSILKLELLNVLTKLIIKYNLRGYYEQLQNILYSLPYLNIFNAIQNIFTKSIEPKINKFQIKDVCQNYMQCSTEFCNTGMVTRYDEFRLQVLVQLLIVIQIAVNFINPQSDQSLKQTVEPSLNSSKKKLPSKHQKAIQSIQINNQQKIKYTQKQQQLFEEKDKTENIGFSLDTYAQFLGVVTLNYKNRVLEVFFRLPYLARHNTQAVKQQILEEVRQIQFEDVYAYLHPLSKVLRDQLQYQKSYENNYLIYPFVYLRSFLNLLIMVLIMTIYFTNVLTSYNLGLSLTFELTSLIVKVIWFSMDFRSFVSKLHYVYSLKAIKAHTLKRNKKEGVQKESKGSEFSFTSLIKSSVIWKDTIRSGIIWKALILCLYVSVLFFYPLYPLIFMMELALYKESKNITKIALQCLKAVVPLILTVLWFLLVCTGLVYHSVDFSSVSQIYGQKISLHTIFIQICRETLQVVLHGQNISQFNQNFPIFQQYAYVALIARILVFLILASIVGNFISIFMKFNKETLKESKICKICLKTQQDFQNDYLQKCQSRSISKKKSDKSIKGNIGKGNSLNFIQHTEYEHSIWNYMYYFIYLDEKSSSNQTISKKIRQQADIQSISEHIAQSHTANKVRQEKKRKCLSQLDGEQINSNKKVNLRIQKAPTQLRDDSQVKFLKPLVDQIDLFVKNKLSKGDYLFLKLH